MPYQCRVIKQYRTEYDHPITIRQGNVLTVGSRDTQWVGWIWCWTVDGKGGWVPESALAIEGDEATALRDYDATELDVQVDDIVTIHTEESGWLWCENSRGIIGWIPKENVEARSQT
jgi:hypothetical protein